MNLSVNQNNIYQPNFTSLKIKVLGEYFEKHPEQKKAIMDRIRNNEGLTEFFKTHDGQITVKALKIPARVYAEYCSCLQEPGKPRGFYMNKPVPKMELSGTYKRPFALKYLFRKPVWFNGGFGGVDCDIYTFNKAWDICMEKMFEIIDEFGNKNAFRGLFNIEKRRQLKEKP